MSVNIGLKPEMIKASVNALNNLLSDHVALLVKSWNFHWNVKGPTFHSYHVFIEEIYDGITEDIDEIAERIRALGERPVGSMKGFLSHVRIKEHAEENDMPEASKMLATLGEDFEAMIRELRTDIQNLQAENTADEGTLSFFSGMIERKEKTAWMLRSFMEK